MNLPPLHLCRCFLKRSGGFSLVSLLVTAAIVGVLLAAAFPSYLRVQERSRSVACVANLRQIGVALQLYLADHQGAYPPNRSNTEFHTDETPGGIHYQDKLKVYLTPYPDSGTFTAEMVGPFWCPADVARARRLAQHSYGCNRYIGGGPDKPRNRSIKREPNPGRRLYLIDATRASLSTCTISSGAWPFNGGPEHQPNTDTRAELRHGGQANALFLDGRVASFAYSQLRGRDVEGEITIP